MNFLKHINNMENKKPNKLIINKKGKRLTIMYGDNIITFDKDKLQPYVNSYSRNIFINDLIEQIKLLSSLYSHDKSNKYKLTDDEILQIKKSIISFLDIKELVSFGKLIK